MEVFMTINLGETFPDISCDCTQGSPYRPRDFHGLWQILYVYPKDNTSGCTQEGLEFMELNSEFVAHQAVVFGVSRDSLASHDRFRAKYAFPFHLISDTDEKLCQALEVLQEKKMYGKSYIGVERSTFVVDPEGKLAAIYRKVKAKGHAATVLQDLRTLQAASIHES
jgi:peroxiredoxin Q/BCP